MTHDRWLQKWEAGKFRGWRIVGEGRIETRADGGITVENFQELTTIGGWNGYTHLLPKGVKPKDPEPQPKRPAQGAIDLDEDDLE
jgi:hypothetical protein